MEPLFPISGDALAHFLGTITMPTTVPSVDIYIDEHQDLLFRWGPNPPDYYWLSFRGRDRDWVETFTTEQQKHLVQMAFHLAESASYL